MIVTGQAVVEWVAQRTGEFGNYGAATGIGVAQDKKLIGGVVYNDYNGASMCMHVAAEPGSNWLSRGVLRVLFDYPFHQAKVNLVIALVGEKNEKSQRLVEGVGFKLFTVIPDAHPDGEMLVYVQRKQDCRWIGKTPLARTKRVDHEQMAA